MYSPRALPSRLVLQALLVAGALVITSDLAHGACDPCFVWRNHGEYVRCVAHDAQIMVEQGLLSEDEGDHIVNQAAQSDVGKRGFVPSGCEPPVCQGGIFSDNFNDGIATGWDPRLETPAFWLEADGTMTFEGTTTGFEPRSLLIQTGTLVLPNYTATYRSRSVDPSEITLRIGGFAFRYQDDLNYIGVVPLLHRTDHNLHFYLFKLKNGVKTQIGGGFCTSTGDLVTSVCDWTQLFDPLTLTNWRSFEVSATGNRYRLAVDGATILEFEDVAGDFLNPSRFGLMFLGGGLSFPHDVDWDDLVLNGCTNQ